MRGDVCDGGPLTAVILTHDLAVGLAAKTRVDRSFDGPDAFVQTNVLGTQALPQARPEAGAAGGVRRRGRR